MRQVPPNPAVHRTLRDKAAQRRLALRYGYAIEPQWRIEPAGAFRFPSNRLWADTGRQIVGLFKTFQRPLCDLSMSAGAWTLALN